MGDTPYRTTEEIAELKEEQARALGAFAAIDEKYRQIANQVGWEEREGGRRDFGFSKRERNERISNCIIIPQPTNKPRKQN